MTNQLDFRYAEASAERNALRARIADLTAKLDALKSAGEMLWTVIANVSQGDWKKQNDEWQTAAERYRDEWFDVLRTLAPDATGETISGSGVEAESARTAREEETRRRKPGQGPADADLNQPSASVETASNTTAGQCQSIAGVALGLPENPSPQGCADDALERIVRATMCEIHDGHRDCSHIRDGFTYAIIVRAIHAATAPLLRELEALIRASGEETFGNAMSVISMLRRELDTARIERDEARVRADFADLALARMERENAELRADLEKVQTENDAYFREVAKQTERADSMRGVLYDARCPSCDGSGAYPVGPNGEPQQCRWCFERNAMFAVESPVTGAADAGAEGAAKP